MKYLFLTLVVITLGVACTVSGRAPAKSEIPATPSRDAAAVATTNPFPVIHVFVALCDNVNQGIVPVSASLGNGDNPKTNLYWRAGFGVKTFFLRNKDWELVNETNNPAPSILERLMFRHKATNTMLVADAYRGREIAQAT